MHAPCASIELSPHCSLDVAQARRFFFTLCAACLAVAGVFAWRGYWPVLPFAGLELAGLGLALRLSMARRHQLQTILISDDEVRIRRQRRDGPTADAAAADVVFPRHWARVKLSPAFSRSHPSRLTIESRGRACEVGEFLTEEERRGLAARLHPLIGRTGETPAIAGAGSCPNVT